VERGVLTDGARCDLATDYFAEMSFCTSRTRAKMHNLTTEKVEWLRMLSCAFCPRGYLRNHMHMEAVRLRGTPKETWSEVVEKHCHIRQLHKEAAVDHNK